MDNNLNPVFTKTFRLKYFFEKKQVLKFEVYDCDSASDDVSHHDKLGHLEVSLAEVVQGRLERGKLLNDSGNKTATIFVTARQSVDCRVSVGLLTLTRCYYSASVIQYKTSEGPSKVDDPLNDLFIEKKQKAEKNFISCSELVFAFRLYQFIISLPNFQMEAVKTLTDIHFFFRSHIGCNLWEGVWTTKTSSANLILTWSSIKRSTESESVITAQMK